MTKTSGIHRLTRDVIDLFELQWQLLEIDSQEARRRVTRGGAYAFVGAVLALSGLTTLLVGCGFLLHEAADWSIGASLLAVAIAVLVVALVLFGLTASKIQAASKSLAETKSEFVENLKWLKAVLISPETSPRNQIRTESFRDPLSARRSDESNRPQSLSPNGR